MPRSCCVDEARCVRCVVETYLLTRPAALSSRRAVLTMRSVQPVKVRYVDEACDVDEARFVAEIALL